MKQQQRPQHAPINFTWNGRKCVTVWQYETMYLCRESHKVDGGLFGVQMEEVQAEQEQVVDVEMEPEKPMTQLKVELFYICSKVELGNMVQVTFASCDEDIKEEYEEVVFLRSIPEDGKKFLREEMKAFLERYSVSAVDKKLFYKQELPNKVLTDLKKGA